MTGPPPERDESPARHQAPVQSDVVEEQDGNRKAGIRSTGDANRIVSIAPATDWFLKAYRPERGESRGFFVRWPVPLWATIQCPGQPDRIEAFVTDGCELVPASEYWTRFYEDGSLVRADELCDCRWPKGPGWARGQGNDAPPPGDFCRACGATVPAGAGE